MSADAAAGLARLLGVAETAVRVTGVASVGAQRKTLFIDVDDGDQTVASVAQISQAIVGDGTPVTDEAELLGLAGEAGVPVPEVLALTDDPSFLGGPSLVCSRIDGLTIPRHILRSIDDDPAAGDLLAADCGTALAQLHSIDPSGVPASIPRLLHHGDYIDELEAQLAELPDPMPAVRYGLRWLRRNSPEPADPALVHGDLRNGNIIVDDNRLVAVLDWELAHVGDPIEDLAWLCLRTWRFGNDDRPVGGFGSLEALRDAYTDAGGAWDEGRFRWWTVARCAWWALGLARQAAAFRAGLIDSIVLAASGRRVVELEYDMLNLIGEAR